MNHRSPIHVAVPLLVLVIGGLFVVIGAAKPTWIWDLGNVRTGRDVVGDGALGAIFIAFGALFAGMGAILLVKRRR